MSKLKEIAKLLRENEDYQTFFKDALRKFGAKTPAEMSDEEKKKFFDYIDKGWDGKVETDEEATLRLEIRRIFEAKGLTKKFNKIVSDFHKAEKEISDAELAMDKQKKDFLSKFKAAKDDVSKEKIKKDHVAKMKKLASALKKKTTDLAKNMRNSELAFNNAIEKLAVPSESELLEEMNKK